MKLYFDVQYPDGITIDEKSVISELQSVIDEIIPNAVISTSAPDMQQFEADAKEKEKQRQADKKRSVKEIEAVDKEMQKRASKMSDEDLPEHVRYLPKEFRDRYKMEAAAEAITKERGV